MTEPRGMPSEIYLRLDGVLGDELVHMDGLRLANTAHLNQYIWRLSSHIGNVPIAPIDRLRFDTLLPPAKGVQSVTSYFAMYSVETYGSIL